MNIKQGKSFSTEEFKNPDVENALTYMWFWNVPVTRELLDREIPKYRAAGVRSIYPVPLSKDFRPDTLRTYLEPEYLSEEFFLTVRYAIDKCIEVGIEPWLYDEGGWPSGSAAGETARSNPEAMGYLLKEREIELKTGESYTPCDGFLALFDGTRRLPCPFFANKDMTLTEYYKERNSERRTHIDYTNERVIDTFIANTYEPYYKACGDLFGKRVPIIFTDEPSLIKWTLADGLFEMFEDRYGYSLLDYIYAIGKPEYDSEEERRARIDYKELSSELFRKSTFAKISKWCSEHNVYFSGHLSGENMHDVGTYYSHLSMLRELDVPGIDVIWEQIRMPVGGREKVDEESKDYPFFPRLGRSAARQKGNNVSVSESLGIYGDGLTHDEMRYVLGYQLIRGINAFNLAPISLGKSRLSAIMTRPNFHPEKPGFYSLTEINSTFERLSYLARLGEAEIDTALYYPAADIAAEGETRDNSIADFKRLGLSLEEGSIDFDIIDDGAIRKATDTGEGLLIGTALYRYITVGNYKYIPDDVKKKLLTYLGKGKARIVPKSSEIRVMTRKLDTGRLIFLFNESAETVTETAEDIISADYENRYLLEAKDGEIYVLPDSLTLSAGETAVILECDKVYNARLFKTVSTVEARIGEAISHKRFNIDYYGMKMIRNEGAPTDVEHFSGEVTYPVFAALPEGYNANDYFRIRLSGFSSTVRIDLGEGERAVGMTPMEITVKASEMPVDGKFTLTVANTAVEEIRAKDEIIKSHPKCEVGVYLYRMEPIEARAPGLKVGRVFVELLENNSEK